MISNPVIFNDEVTVDNVSGLSSMNYLQGCLLNQQLIPHISAIHKIILVIGINTAVLIPKKKFN